VACAAATLLGVNPIPIKEALMEFPGTWKRFEFRGKLKNGVFMYDDYAHHPTEIMATLEGFRELYPQNKGWRITVIFQPHLFSRTKLLLDDFAKSFKGADEVILLPIYFAREINDGTISSDILADEINKNTKNAKSFPNFEEVEKYLQNKLSNMVGNDIIVTMGAGEASKVGDFLLKM